MMQPAKQCYLQTRCSHYCTLIRLLESNEHCKLHIDQRYCRLNLLYPQHFLTTFVCFSFNVSFFSGKACPIIEDFFCQSVIQDHNYFVFKKERTVKTITRIPLLYFLFFLDSQNNIFFGECVLFFKTHVKVLISHLPFCTILCDQSAVAAICRQEQNFQEELFTKDQFGSSKTGEDWSAKFSIE